jgi:Ca-activated chloride channel family protein
VQRGIGLTTIGVGNDFDVALMRGLAEQGAGNFYFLEDPTAATEVFTEELDYFMQPIALDIKIDAAAGPGYRFGEAVGSRLWSGQAAAGTMVLPAVFIASRTSQSGEQGRRGGGSMIFIHLTPIAGSPGRVADLSLSFRRPGSPERITQKVSLDYGPDPAETPDVPYLSVPEMAERYAMYNMFVGLRAATRAAPGCATAALKATRAGATAWNQTHEDPDLAADLMLVEQYLTNLETYDVYGETSVSSCAAASEPYQPPGTPIDYYPSEPPREYACSAGGASGGLPVLGAMTALGLVARRRRSNPRRR